MTGEAEVAVLVFDYQMVLFGVERVMATQATDPAVSKKHVLVQLVRLFQLAVHIAGSTIMHADRMNIERTALVAAAAFFEADAVVRGIGAVMTTYAVEREGVDFHLLVATHHETGRVVLEFTIHGSRHVSGHLDLGLEFIPINAVFQLGTECTLTETIVFVGGCQGVIALRN